MMAALTSVPTLLGVGSLVANGLVWSGYGGKWAGDAADWAGGFYQTRMKKRIDRLLGKRAKAIKLTRGEAIEGSLVFNLTDVSTIDVEKVKKKIEKESKIARFKEGKVEAKTEEEEEKEFGIRYYNVQVIVDNNDVTLGEFDFSNWKEKKGFKVVVTPKDTITPQNEDGVPLRNDSTEYNKVLDTLQKFAKISVSKNLTPELKAKDKIGIETNVDVPLIGNLFGGIVNDFVNYVGDRGKEMLGGGVVRQYFDTDGGENRHLKSDAYVNGLIQLATDQSMSEEKDFSILENYYGTLEHALQNDRFAATQYKQQLDNQLRIRKAARRSSTLIRLGIVLAAILLTAIIIGGFVALAILVPGVGTVIGVIGGIVTPIITGIVTLFGSRFLAGAFGLSLASLATGIYVKGKPDYDKQRIKLTGDRVEILKESITELDEKIEEVERQKLGSVATLKAVRELADELENNLTETEPTLDLSKLKDESGNPIPATDAGLAIVCHHMLRKDVGFSKCKNLVLKNCSITSSGVKALIHTIQSTQELGNESLAQIESIDLSGNKINEEGMVKIADFLLDNFNIVSLDHSGNPEITQETKNKIDKQIIINCYIREGTIPGRLAQRAKEIFSESGIKEEAKKKIKSSLKTVTFPEPVSEDVSVLVEKVQRQNRLFRKLLVKDPKIEDYLEAFKIDAERCNEFLNSERISARKAAVQRRKVVVAISKDPIKFLKGTNAKSCKALLSPLYSGAQKKDFEENVKTFAILIDGINKNIDTDSKPHMEGIVGTALKNLGQPPDEFKKTLKKERQKIARNNDLSVGERRKMLNIVDPLAYDGDGFDNPESTNFKIHQLKRLLTSHPDDQISESAEEFKVIYETLPHENKKHSYFEKLPDTSDNKKMAIFAAMLEEIGKIDEEDNELNELARTILELAFRNATQGPDQIEKALEAKRKEIATSTKHSIKTRREALKIIDYALYHKNLGETNSLKFTQVQLVRLVRDHPIVSTESDITVKAVEELIDACKELTKRKGKPGIFKDERMQILIRMAENLNEDDSLTKNNKVMRIVRGAFNHANRQEAENFKENLEKKRTQIAQDHTIDIETRRKILNMLDSALHPSLDQTSLKIYQLRKLAVEYPTNEEAKLEAFEEFIEAYKTLNPEEATAVFDGIPEEQAAKFLAFVKKPGVYDDGKYFEHLRGMDESHTKPLLMFYFKHDPYAAEDKEEYENKAMFVASILANEEASNLFLDNHKLGTFCKKWLRYVVSWQSIGGYLVDHNAQKLSVIKNELEKIRIAAVVAGDFELENAIDIPIQAVLQANLSKKFKCLRDGSNAKFAELRGELEENYELREFDFEKVKLHSEVEAYIKMIIHRNVIMDTLKNPATTEKGKKLQLEEIINSLEELSAENRTLVLTKIMGADLGKQLLNLAKHDIHNNEHDVLYKMADPSLRVEIIEACLRKQMASEAESLPEAHEIAVMVSELMTLEENEESTFYSQIESIFPKQGTMGFGGTNRWSFNEYITNLRELTEKDEKIDNVIKAVYIARITRKIKDNPKVDLTDWLRKEMKKSFELLDFEDLKLEGMEVNEKTIAQLKFTCERNKLKQQVELGKMNAKEFIEAYKKISPERCKEVFQGMSRRSLSKLILQDLGSQNNVDCQQLRSLDEEHRIRLLEHWFTAQENDTEDAYKKAVFVSKLMSVPKLFNSEDKTVNEIIKYMIYWAITGSVKNNSGLPYYNANQLLVGTSYKKSIYNWALKKIGTDPSDNDLIALKTGLEKAKKATEKPVKKVESTDSFVPFPPPKKEFVENREQIIKKRNSITG